MLSSVLRHNPGNIDHSEQWLWEGEVWPQSSEPVSRFAQFIDDTHGIRAVMYELRQYYLVDHCRTVKDFIYRWAPRVENNTDAYIDDFCGYFNKITPAGYHYGALSSMNVLDPVVLMAAAESIIHHELGLIVSSEHPYSNKVYEDAMNMLPQIS